MVWLRHMHKMFNYFMKCSFDFGSGVFLLRLLPGLLRGVSKWFCPMFHMEYKRTNMDCTCFREARIELSKISE